MPVSVRLVGLYPEDDKSWQVVLAARGFDGVTDPLVLASAVADLRDRLKDDPPRFFHLAGWETVGAPTPAKGDDIEVLVLLVGDFDELLFEV